MPTDVMAAKLKHPGLQAKFEQLLKEILANGEALSIRAIMDAARTHSARLGMSPAELDDLYKNFANYSSRARKNDVIVSNGSWGGYQLTRDTLAARVASDGAPPTPVGSATRPATEPPQAAVQRKHWESFLHLPLTVALSRQFDSRVLSLPNAPDAVRWGNPDMLMVRPSALAQIEELDGKLDPQVFKVVDVTPECVLASIEVKAGLERDRSKLFTAIAEAAANSRWANEAWLVFVDRQQERKPLEEDVISLARSVEVGILEIAFAGASPVLETIVHLAAPTRATLRVNELKSERASVLIAAQNLLREWQTPTPTFLDVESAEQKARVLIGQAISNLRTQRGFGPQDRFADAIKPFRADRDDSDYTLRVLQASIRSAALAGDVVTDEDLVAVLTRAAEDGLVQRQAATIKEVLEAIGPTTLQSAPTE